MISKVPKENLGIIQNGIEFINSIENLDSHNEI